MCKGLYSNPKILRCLHFYCKGCLERKMKEGGGVVICPKCEDKNNFSTVDIDRLPKAFLDGEIKILHSMMSHVVEDKRSVVCELCKHPSLSPALAYCHTCAKYLCYFCEEAHDRLKPYANHIVLKLNDFTLTSDHLDLLEAPVKMICPEHDEDTKIYCFDCDHLICRDCVVKDHKDHNYDFVKKISDNFIKELHSKHESLQSNYTFLGKINSKIKERLTQMNSEGLDAINFVNQSFDIVLRQFEKYRSNLLISIQNRMGANKKELTMKQKNTEAVQKNIQQLMTSIQQSVYNTQREKVILSHKKIMQQVSENEKSCLDMSEDIQVHDSSFLVYKTSCARIIGAIGDSLKSADPIMCSVEGVGAGYAQIGKEASFILHVAQSNEAPCQARQNVQVEMTCIDDCSTCSTEVKMINGSTYEVSYQPKVQGQHLLKIRVNERPIVGNPFEVLVKKPIVEMNDPITIIKGVKKLGDLAIYRDGNIIATQYETGAVISTDKKGKHIETLIRGLGTPYGITTNPAGEIFITQNKKCRLLKYNKKLKLIETIGCKEGTLGNFNKPGRLAINNRSEIFVCDVKNSRVQVFEDDLDYIRWFSVSKPTGISVDREGSALVVEQGKNSLCKIFDASMLGRTNIVEQLRNPQGVYVDNEYIYVTEKDIAQVSVFDHQGGMVTSLGQGILKEPGSIVGDADGHLYVCDEGLEAICVF